VSSGSFSSDVYWFTRQTRCRLVACNLASPESITLLANCKAVLGLCLLPACQFSILHHYSNKKTKVRCAACLEACLLAPCTSREHSRDMVHFNCLDSLTAGLKQTTAFCMIGNLYHDLYQGVLGWFCGLGSELELAHSGAVHPADFPMAGPWCQLQVAAPRPTSAHFTSSKRAVLEHLVMVGDGKGSQFMHLLRNALHLTLQARCHHCPGCHFELEQAGFTATYRPRQCLLTSRNTNSRYAELGFWSHTGLNLAHGTIVISSGHCTRADAMP
jgi:hypothetical protein